MRNNNFIRRFTLKILNGFKATGSGHADEEMQERDFIEQFGFASSPPSGSKGVAIAPDGFIEKACVMGLSHDAYKPDLSEGESCQYDKFGNKIHLKDGEFVITVNGNLTLNVVGNVNIASEGAVSVTSPNISLNGNISSIGGTFGIGGSGGQPVARVGDQVQVGDAIGTIITGSSISTSH